MTQRFVAIDLDRTLIATEILYELLIDELRSEGIVDIAAVIAARQTADKTGQSYDVGAVIRALYAEKIQSGEQVESYLVKLKAALKARQTKQGRDVLLPGARQLLDRLSAKAIPFGVMTYGGAWWQAVKFELSFMQTPYLHTPLLIVATPQKGAQIAQWPLSQGQYVQLPKVFKTEQQIEQVILIDDKLAAFDGLPAWASGYHVRWDTRQPLGQLPSSVQAVVGLNGIVIE